MHSDATPVAATRARPGRSARRCCEDQGAEAMDRVKAHRRRGEGPPGRHPSTRRLPPKLTTATSGGAHSKGLRGRTPIAGHGSTRAPPRRRGRGERLAAEREAASRQSASRQALGLEARRQPQALAKACVIAPVPHRSGWVPVLFVSSSMPVATLRTYAASLSEGSAASWRFAANARRAVGRSRRWQAERADPHGIDPGCEGPGLRDARCAADHRSVGVPPAWHHPGTCAGDDPWRSDPALLRARRGQLPAPAHHRVRRQRHFPDCSKNMPASAAERRSADAQARLVAPVTAGLWPRLRASAKAARPR